MLVLQRKRNEQIVIKVPGVDDITITVVGHGRGHIKLGCEGPRDVMFDRPDAKSHEPREDGAK